jgi:hypothetical protein
MNEVHFDVMMNKYIFLHNKFKILPECTIVSSGSPFPLRVGSHRSRDKSDSPPHRRTSSHHQDSWYLDQSTHQGIFGTISMPK